MNRGSRNRSQRLTRQARVEPCVARGCQGCGGRFQHPDKRSAEPGTSGRQVAAATSLDPATVTYHVQRLQKAGLVEAKRYGRRLAIFPTGPGFRAASDPTAAAARTASAAGSPVAAG